MTAGNRTSPHSSSRLDMVVIAFVVILLLFVYACLAAWVQIGDPLLTPTKLFHQLFLPIQQQQSIGMLIQFYGRLLLHIIPLITGLMLGYAVPRMLVQQLYRLSPSRADSYLPPSYIGQTPPIVTIDYDQWPNQIQQYALLHVGGPGYIEIENPNVVITEQDGRYSRILVAGRQRLKQFEYVVSVIKIKNYQDNKNDIELISREGFAWQLNLTIQFSIQGCSIRYNGPLNEPIININETNLRKAVYADTHYNNNLLSWHELPIHIAHDQLIAIASTHLLNDVIDHYNGHQLLPNKTTIRNELESQLRDMLVPYGIELHYVDINGLRIDGRFLEIYVNKWREMMRQRAFFHREQEKTDEEKTTDKRNAIRQDMMENLARGFSHTQDRAMHSNVLVEMMEMLKHNQRDDEVVSQPSPMVDELPDLSRTPDTLDPKYVMVEREKLNNLYRTLRQKFPDEV